MKVAELKQKIEPYKAAQLRRLVVEMYKAMPKSLKQGKGIDELICNPASGRKKQEAETPIDMGFLSWEVEQFLDDAYNQYYFAPNSVIPKRERPKWRFIALRLFKQLNQAAADPHNVAEASKLLEQLYGMLCYSCQYVLFNSDDPFQSVGIAQPDFLHAVLRARRQVESESSRDFVRNSIFVALGHSLNGNAPDEQLMEVVIGFLTTPDLKQLAIAGCDEIRRSIEKDGLPRLDAGHWQDDSHSDYRKKRMLQSLGKMGFMCHMALFEPGEAVDYFLRHSAEKDPEIRLYVLLRMIQHYGNEQLWMKVYEQALKNCVRPRPELKELYEKFRREADQPSSSMSSIDGPQCPATLLGAATEAGDPK